MTHAEATARAVKLLRLATSDNANEAALAAAKAQEIIDRYKLGAIALDSETPAAAEEPIMDLGADPLDRASTLSTWKTRLAMAIAAGNQCKIYRNGGDLKIIGRPSDAQTVRYLFGWLRQEVERLAARDGLGLGRTWLNNYRIGVVETISIRLRQQKKETEAAVVAEAPNPAAIVLVRSAIVRMEQRAQAVEVFAREKMHLRSGGSGHQANYDHNARMAGRQAGNEINMNRSAGALGAHQKKIGGQS